MSDITTNAVTNTALNQPLSARNHKKASARLQTPTSPRHGVSAFFAYAVLILVFICFIVPMLWLFLAAFDKNASFQTKIPKQWTLGNFSTILNTQTTFRPMWNSAILAFVATFIVITFAVLAAYPLSRYQSRFNKPFLYTVLFGTCLPMTCLMVPVYSLFVTFHLIDSIIGTILFLAASSLPMAIWMTKNYMDSVPMSLEEAAWVDGASMMQTLGKIVVPLMKPGLAAVSIFVLMGTWGNFFVPYMILISPSKQPASVSIYSFFGQNGLIAYGQLAAFSLLYSAPVVLLYALSNHVLGTYSLAGGIKG
ncbi:carbohydrate ABC transporter permease [Bifidobacterium bombi]|uniref:Sugar ABC transporter, permease protein n=1 Tax=Bifidobacterium bombi DSM 19703 TaxID=1341695 RepID=A0A080N2Z2_9BIFI|nr:carbohydrate ABC transporter permease [Bifidobacterium bombi]KFF31427.1 sugar ABC transporter, permease protein [Bifidobacterium bombi DSM 19703]